MTAKEELLERITKLSEAEADEALRLLVRQPARGRGVDPWGDLDSWSDAAGNDSMRMLDVEEAAISFIWKNDRP